MILLFILVWGMAIGWIALLVVRGFDTPVNWGEALSAGLAGSFVGGMLGSLINGDGIEFRASGIVGSIIGAILLLLVVSWVRGRRQGARR
ncbi:MAG: GlsB/YeaQ/YmgE family stress response membrane protein [Acidimicrobiia bacterium]